MKIRMISFALILALLALLATPHLAHASSPPPSDTSGCGLLPASISQEITANEPWYCPINQQLYDQWSKDLPMAAAAMLLAFSVAALIVMVGIAMKSDRIKNFGIGEVYEATASAIIVGIFLYVCAVLFGIVPGVYVVNYNPFPTAFHLMTNTIVQIKQVYSNYYNQYTYYKYITSLAPTVSVTGDISVNLPSSLLSFPWVLPLTIRYTDPLNTLGGILSDGLTVLWTEYYMLVFFSVASIPVFLIPGVVFRAILPTRALGGMLISIAIAFYLVMPTLFSVAYAITYPGIRQQLETTVEQSSTFVTGPGVASVASATSPMVMELEIAQQNIEGAMSSFWLLILFYPLLIIAMTYAFVTQLANVIGGSARIGGRMRGLV